MFKKPADTVRCKYCHESYSPSVHGPHECKVRKEYQALIDRGNITVEEYEAFRGNSWEHEAIISALNNQALMKYAHTILKNSTHNRTSTSRPCSTYDEALAVVLVPELLKRLQVFADKEVEDMLHEHMNQHAAIQHHPKSDIIAEVARKYGFPVKDVHLNRDEQDWTGLPSVPKDGDDSDS